MTLISASNLGISFGATTLLEGITFSVGEGDRWGIVGRNGSGKSSLFKILTGDLQPSAGSVARQPGLRHALLDQHRAFEGVNTVWDAAATAFRDVIELEQSLAEQAAKLAELGEKTPNNVLERFGRDQERFGDMGGYTFHARVDAVLQGLGFDAEESKTRPIGTLSGGERGRVGLAAQLIAPAELLLLDEPTNHLDLDTTTWLQDWLKECNETIIVISHDRAFLDVVADHILHLEGGTGETYRGGYSSFVSQRAERRLSRDREVERQRKFIAKEEDYIRRNIAGVNTAQAKGRRKRLDRLPRLTPPPGAEGSMTLRLDAAERGGDKVITANKLTVKVEDRVLVSNFTGVAQRGDVIALVGPNGAGKSTLLSTLLGHRAPAGGEAKVGGSISPAWFRQDLADLPLDKTMYDAIADLRPLWTRGAIQNHLGAFGFTGQEVMRGISSLSGGERARMALAIITLAHANLLVLDEPTNHLDVESIESIEDALEEYEGTVVLVSHDRAFLRELATRVWAFEGTHITDFDGAFVEWEEWKAAKASTAARALADAESARKQQERGRAKKTVSSQTDDQAERR
ncbi:MAG TPA: ABC-F family ATP-binding cassette domain-containing protein, partial [Gemmatimonadaceae bacterium]|nr:ABC-F family ATP-binding cassette domain-containing protein [Gemmatimonadaceae bacterium]